MIDTGFSSYQNKNVAMSQRAGASQSSYDANDYFQEFETAQPSASANRPPQNADDYFSQFESQPNVQPQPTSSRVASAFEQLPATALEKPLGTPGGSIERSLQGPITNFFKQYPGTAGTLAGIVTAAAIPEAALARMLPIAGSALWGLTKYAGKKLTDYEILSHLLHP